MGLATITELSVGPPAPSGLQSWPPPPAGHPCRAPHPTPTQGHRGPAGPRSERWKASDAEGPHAGDGDPGGGGTSGQSESCCSGLKAERTPQKYF